MTLNVFLSLFTAMYFEDVQLIQLGNLNYTLMKTQNKTIDPARFDKKINEQPISLFTLTNATGASVQITNYGARIVGLWVPDRFGTFDDVVLGYDNITSYIESTEKYFGAAIGRYANRIAGAQFSINGKTYKLQANENGHLLHGGATGFHQVAWDVTHVESNNLVLSYHSHAGECGFPGNLYVELSYYWSDDYSLEIKYTATTDESTPISLTNHTYFNLCGAGKGTIDQHVLTLYSNSYLPVDQELIPTGEFASVGNTGLDFRAPLAIGSRIESDKTIIQSGGYDHCYILEPNAHEPNLIAHVLEPISGRQMEVVTNTVGVQLYTSNDFDGSVIGKQNKPYGKRAAFCLECQSLPNSPNTPHFPSTILHVGETYRSTCMYRFSTQ